MPKLGSLPAVILVVAIILLVRADGVIVGCFQFCDWNDDNIKIFMELWDLGCNVKT